MSEKDAVDVEVIGEEVDARGDSAPDNRFRLRLSGKIGLAVVIAWVLIALLAPWIAPYSEEEFVSYDSFLPAFDEYVLGTDYIGRDMLSRLIHGSRLTIFMALCATIIASTLGTLMGTIAAVKGGWVDQVISRINDAFLSFPTIMLGLVVIAALGSSIPILIICTGLIYASSVFRIARALAADQVAMDYIEVARTRGEGTFWLLGSEVLPNIVVPLVVDFGIRLAFTILFLSGMSFLGLGVQPPAADWGSMVRENIASLTSGRWTAIYPAMAIASLTIGLNLMVDDYTAHSGRGIAGKLV
ncbi:ABC transporter permease [Roseovarius sp. 2305UL8-3]|uniref:ABC transporter permease n=1 Tax=Roseovarius conchicola TaxID=3121636 RepID=UPI003528855C